MQISMTKGFFFGSKKQIFEFDLQFASIMGRKSAVISKTNNQNRK